MTKEDITIELTEREVVKKQLNTLREGGTIPAVIHNHGKDSILVQGDEVALSKLYVRAGKSQPVNLKVGKKDYYTLIKDVDISPTKHRLRHIVFQAVRRGEKIHAEVSIQFKEGVNPPAQGKGLMVLRQLDTVEVNAIPSKLPETLYVDPSTLENIGDRLAIKDIPVPEGVEILAEPETQIAIVEEPKDQAAEADAAAADLAEDADAPAEVPSEQGGDEDADESGESDDAEASSEEEKDNDKNKDA